jgi:hypothetical protein
LVAVRVTDLLAARFGVALGVVVCVDSDVVALESGIADAGLSAVGVGWVLTAESGGAVVGGASCAKAVVVESARAAAIAIGALVYAWRWLIIMRTNC